MYGNRKAATAMILKYVKQLEGGNENVDMYTTLFAGLTDKAFDDYMQDIESGNAYISLIIPNGGKSTLTTARSIKVGEALGVNYFQRVKLTDPVTGDVSLSNVPYMVMDLVARRQNQHLVKKRSIPEGSAILDHMTGQVTADDKGSRISLPELLALSSRGFDGAVIEMIKVRGGDKEAYAAMRKSISETGAYKLGPIMDMHTQVTGTETLKSLLNGMHYKVSI